MKVFQLNEYDWYVGPDLEACVQHAMEYTGLPREDVFDPQCAHELTDEEMQRLKYVEDDGEKRTFAEELALQISVGLDFPRIFASTEY